MMICTNKATAWLSQCIKNILSCVRHNPITDIGTTEWYFRSLASEAKRSWILLQEIAKRQCLLASGKNHRPLCIQQGCITVYWPFELRVPVKLSISLLSRKWGMLSRKILFLRHWQYSDGKLNSKLKLLVQQGDLVFIYQKSQNI